MLTWLTQFFTWWNGQTLNTRWHTSWHGELVGRDEFGNAYYRTKGGAIDRALGFQRRWVIFNGPSEASVVPPGWFGWLHHQTEEPPADGDYKAHEWELPHRANMTGTDQAYRPSGSILREAARPPATGDYKAWQPGA